MAIVYACDATGKTVGNKDELVQVGVRDRLYCPDIAPVMVEYAAAVDALHGDCAKRFTDGLEKLRKQYRKKIEMPEPGKLPDE